VTSTVHPFGGGSRYPWDRAEARALHDELAGSITNANQIDILVKKAAPQIPALNLGWPPAQLWSQALEDTALADRLLALCRTLVDDSGKVAVARAAQAVLDARPAVERRVGSDGRLVLGREELRTVLDQLAADGAPVKVVLVRGQPKTGKTWSKILFERAARDRGAEVVYLRGLTTPTVRNVVQKLFEVAGAPDQVPHTDTTDSAWFQSVSYRLPAVVRDRGKPLWIAVDDLGPGEDGKTPLIDEQIRLFFDTVALSLEDPWTSRWLRLLLIHYPENDTPTRWPEEVWQLDKPGELTEQDVALAIQEWSSDHQVTLLPTQVTASARAVVTRAEAPLAADDVRARHPRVRRIHDECVVELANLASGTSGG
jgi:hypothetical protein